MKKIIFAFVMALILTISVFPGGNKQSSSSSIPTSAAAITVRLLTDATGFDDKSFNAAAWRGILEYYGDTWQNQKNRGKSYDVVTAQTQDMYIPNLRQATDESYDLIITTGFTWAAAIKEVAAQNPGQKYLIVDYEGINLPNVMQAMYEEHEGSYLVGVAAALKAKEDNIANPRFGFIGGVPGAVITKFEVGYLQGIFSVIPNAKVVDYYVNSWGEPAKAKAQAKNWFDSGINTIYTAAGFSGNGAIAQAKEYRAAGRNVWVIGVDSDQYEDGIYKTNESAVLTSMIKRVETSVIYALKAIQNKTFKGEVIRFDLKSDGVGYSSSNSVIGPDIKTEIEKVKQRIVSGQLKVASTYAEAKKLSGFPQNLMAVDDK